MAREQVIRDKAARHERTSRNLRNQLGGFAFRTRPAEGTLDDLWVKELTLDAPEGGLALLITVDRHAG